MATITSPRPQSPASLNRNAIQSPTLTPSSSVRPSFDLPAGTDGRIASPAPGPAVRRNRAALRDYYNLKSKATTPGNLSRTASVASVGSEGTVTSTTENVSSTALPPHLDDPKFDAPAFVQKLLQTETLRGILKIEGSLVSEIKQLDGERKALVYDNYSKLIVATRTIGRMQKSLDGNEEHAGGLKSLEKLRPAVEGIERMANDLGRPGETESVKAPDGAKRREQREKKELVRWVVEAPGRFERLLQEGGEEEVTAEWESVKGLLEKWKGVKGVDEVRDACEKTVRWMERPAGEGE